MPWICYGSVVVINNNNNYYYYCVLSPLHNTSLMDIDGTIFSSIERD